MTNKPVATKFVGQREYRDALGMFATGVAVVTTVASDGERIGSTVSSFNSVSLEPPLILFSIACNAKAFPIWQAAEHFAVNVLNEEQSDLSNRFARALTDKWDGVETVSGQTRAPILKKALASFECQRHADCDGGDHLIIIGRVVALKVQADSARLPLLFFRSKYHRLDPEHDNLHAGEALLHGW